MAVGSMAKATIHEKVGHTGQGLWKQKGLQLPAYIQHVANDLKPKHGESRAVEMAIGIVRNWKDGHDGKGHKVSPSTQAAAAKAWAEWEALKASRHGGKLKEAAEVLPDPPAVTDEDLKAMAKRAGRRLALLEARELPATGEGALFDQLLVDAARLLESPAGGRPRAASATGGPAHISTRGRGGAGVAAARRITRGRRQAPSPPGSPSNAAFDQLHPRGAPGTSSGGKFVAKGSTGTEVRAVQRRVGARVDGSFDAKTKAAVEAFQKQHGLVVDGVVGRQTVAAFRGRKDAKRVTTGELSAADRKFLAGHVRSKGGTPRTTKIVEAAAFDPNLHPKDRLGRWRAKVGGLKVGDTAKLPDGVSVKRSGPKSFDVHAPGGRTGRVAGSGDPLASVSSADHAATLAAQRSAQSDHPQSLGGTTKHRSLNAFLSSGGANDPGASHQQGPLAGVPDAARRDARAMRESGDANDTVQGMLKSKHGLSDEQALAVVRDMIGTDEARQKDAGRRSAADHAAAGKLPDAPALKKPTRLSDVPIGTRFATAPGGPVHRLADRHRDGFVTIEDAQGRRSRPRSSGLAHPAPASGGGIDAHKVDKGSITHEGKTPDGRKVRIRRPATSSGIVVEHERTAGEGNFTPNTFTPDATGEKAAHAHFLAHVKGGDQGAAREQSGRLNLGGTAKLSDLRPGEQTALRQVASGKPGQLSAGHRRRLIALGLIRSEGLGVRVTDKGHRFLGDSGISVPRK